MKLNIFRSRGQQEKVAHLDEAFGFSNFENIIKPAIKDLEALFSFHKLDIGLIKNPWQLEKQKTSPSLFSICSFSSSDPNFYFLLSISNNLYRNFDFQIIEYCKARLLITDSLVEIGFIMDFLSQHNPKGAIETVFDVIDDLADLTYILQDSKSMFKRESTILVTKEQHISFLNTLEYTCPAEMILKIRTRIILLIDTLETDLLPAIIKHDYESLEGILTFSTRVFHTVFKSKSKHTHTFQMKLLRLFKRVIDIMEPFDSGYISQSFRIETMEFLNQYLLDILKSLTNERVSQNEYLVKLLMPYDAAIEFNLKLRNFSIEDIALTTSKTDTVLERIIEFAISIGVWSHPDFLLNRSGKKALDDFNRIYLELLRLEQLQQFLLTDILLLNLLYCEFRLPDYFTEHLLGIPPEQTEEISALWRFIIQNLR